MDRRLRQVACSAIAVALCAGCDSTPPSDQSVNLTGTWTGQIGSPGTGSAVRVTWVAIQSGSNVTGTATLLKPANGVNVPGNLAAVQSGSQLTLSYLASAGAVPPLPACTVSGSGSATLTSGNAIAGTMTLVVAGCAGSGIESVAGAPLALGR
jgi:hypothetical protein